MYVITSTSAHHTYGGFIERKRRGEREKAPQRNEANSENKSANTGTQNQTQLKNWIFQAKAQSHFS
jgi:hypothetical protein